MASNQELLSRLQVECLRIEEDCIYNSVGHFCAATFWSNVNHCLGFPIAIFSIVAAFCTFSLPEVATALSIGTTILAVASLYFRPPETAAKHFQCAGKHKDLRQTARVFREVTLLASSRLSEKDLLAKFDELKKEKRVISELGVPLPDFAYRCAKRKIEEGRAAYYVDHLGAVNARTE